MSDREAAHTAVADGQAGRSLGSLSRPPPNTSIVGRTSGDRAVIMGNRRQGVSALLAALTVSTIAAHAFASGHMPGGPLTFVALFWAMLPVIVPWSIGLGTHLGRMSGLKFMFGFLGSLLATIVCFLVPDDGTSLSSLFLFGGVVGALALVAHVVRFAVYLFGRATGGRSKEVLKKWWKYL